MSGRTPTVPSLDSDNTALREDALDAVNGGLLLAPHALDTGSTLHRAGLRIGDPNNPKEVAEGLKRLF
jgi:hypothetical protein